MAIQEQVPQHMVALSNANKTRFARAELKRRVKAGEKTIGELLTGNGGRPDPAVESMPIWQLLGWPYRWGPERVRKVLREVGISELRRVDQLTDRQLDVLVRELTPVRERPVLPPQERERVLEVAWEGERGRASTRSAVHYVRPGELKTLCGRWIGHWRLSPLLFEEDALCGNCAGKPVTVLVD